MIASKLIRVTFLGALCYGMATAQTPAPTPRRPAPPVKAGKVRAPAAPQVVTIVHRLNALKMFRLLARSEEQVQAIAGLDAAFNLMDDVHTNVIAGLAMDDGETIAAWLPEADVEGPDISVIGPDGKRLAAKYVGLDAVTGLSILKLTD